MNYIAMLFCSRVMNTEHRDAGIVRQTANRSKQHHRDDDLMHRGDCLSCCRPVGSVKRDPMIPEICAQGVPMSQMAIPLAESDVLLGYLPNDL